MLLLRLFLLVNAFGQTGGTYEIKQSVIANGGGESDGAAYSITIMAAQPSAGVNSTGGTLGIRGGFWQPNLAPTAVSVGGQVWTAYAARR